MQAYLPLGFWVLTWFVSIGLWKEGQQTAATVIVIVGNDEEAAHRNVAGFFCPLLCLPASNYYSCAAADSCGVYTVWGLLSSFAASSWHESSSSISFDSWLGFASPSCGCVQGLGYPLFELKKTWNRLRNRNPPTAFSLSLSSLTSENTSCSAGRDINSVASIGLLAMITRYCFMSVASKLLPFKFDYFRSTTTTNCLLLGLFNLHQLV